MAPAAQAKAAHLTTLVLGGQGRLIGALAGRPAETAGLESFVHGLRGALLASSALTLIASAVAFVGLRHSGAATQVVQIAEAAPARAFDEVA
jgi:hypothetical protein